MYQFSLKKEIEIMNSAVTDISIIRPNQENNYFDKKAFSLRSNFLFNSHLITPVTKKSLDGLKTCRGITFVFMNMLAT